MRRFVVFLFLLQFGLAASVWAQVAKIIDVEGDVQVKADQLASWQKAKPQTYLDREAEIMTGVASECSIAFDEQLENILTIKENSHIALENIQPGKIHLPKGRVFSLIDDIVSIKEFTVRTPTAVAGVRGTGDSVEANDNGTTVKCFEGTVNVEGVSPQGSPTQDPLLGAGSGVDVDNQGDIGDPFDLGDEDYEEWNDFKDDVNDLRAGDGEDEDDSGDDDLSGLEDEQDDDVNDRGYEELREELEEEPCPPNGGPSMGE